MGRQSTAHLYAKCICCESSPRVDYRRLIHSLNGRAAKISEMLLQVTGMTIEEGMICRACFYKLNSAYKKCTTLKGNVENYFKKYPSEAVRCRSAQDNVASEPKEDDLVTELKAQIPMLMEIKQEHGYCVASTKSQPTQQSDGSYNKGADKVLDANSAGGENLHDSVAVAASMGSVVSSGDIAAPVIASKMPPSSDIAAPVDASTAPPGGNVSQEFTVIVTNDGIIETVTANITENDSNPPTVMIPEVALISNTQLTTGSTSNISEGLIFDEEVGQLINASLTNQANEALLDVEPNNASLHDQAKEASLLDQSTNVASQPNQRINKSRSSSPQVVLPLGKSFVISSDKVDVQSDPLSEEDVTKLANESSKTWQMMRNILAYFRSTNTLCDVNLMGCDYQQTTTVIYAHSVVLAAASQFFHSLLTESSKLIAHSETPLRLSLSFVDTKMLDLVVKYIYGELPKAAVELEYVKKFFSSVRSLIPNVKKTSKGMTTNKQVLKKTKKAASKTENYACVMLTDADTSVDQEQIETAQLSETESYYEVCFICCPSHNAKSKYKLFKHFLEKHPDVAHYFCTICGFYRKTKQSVVEHCKKVHDIEAKERSMRTATVICKTNIPKTAQKFVSTASKTGFAPTSDLLDDGWLHETFYCFKCQVNFISKSSFLDHLKEHLNEVKSKVDVDRVADCYVCGLVFEDPSMIDTHFTQFHPGVEPIAKSRKRYIAKKLVECKICNKRFTEQTLQKHTARCVPLRCNTCQKTFTLRSTYKEHMAKHANRMGYACNECGLKFNTARHLRYHRQNRHTSVSRMCSVCNAEFSNLPSFQQHMKIHETVEMQYICSMCGDTFQNEELFMQHLNDLHSITLSEPRIDVTMFDIT